MAEVIETFAEIGNRRYCWAQMAGASHVAVSIDRLEPHIVCDILHEPERIGATPQFVAQPQLPLCANCRQIMDDFDGWGARNLVRALEELEGVEQP